MNGLIFVSYRRQDTQSATGRLCDKLQLHFGIEQVFHDVESIEPGADFAAIVAAKVASSSVVLAMIGRRWLEPNNTGRPRLHDPDDLVRLEIATALQRGVPIIPVLVEGAAIPPRSQLPEDVAPLFDHQAHEITESRWQYDSDRLLQQLEKTIPADHPVRSDVPAWRDALQALVSYVPDVVQLLVRPRRYVAVLAAQPNYVLRGAVFFVISQLVAAWLFVLPSMVVSVPAFVLDGVPMGAFILMLVVIPLHLAARSLRVPSHAPTTFTIAAYLESVAMMVAAAGVHVLWAGFLLEDPNFAPAIRDAVSAAVKAETRFERLTAIVNGAIGPAFMGAFALAFVLWLYAAVWLVVASGAFRDAWRISRLRAAAVFVLFAILFGLVAGLVTFSAVG